MATKIIPKTIDEAMTLVYNILNQGDSRYNDPENELILANFIIDEAISLEEREIPFIEDPKENGSMFQFEVQWAEKYIAKNLLKLDGFKDDEIFFERRFLGSQPDVMAESQNKIILVECCSCRISKMLSYLPEAEEVWILTRGLLPYDKIPYLKEKMQWFIFRKGINWNKVTDFKKDQLKELKKIKLPIDSLMESEENKTKKPNP